MKHITWWHGEEKKPVTLEDLKPQLDDLTKIITTSIGGQIRYEIDDRDPDWLKIEWRIREVWKKRWCYLTRTIYIKTFISYKSMPEIIAKSFVEMYLSSITKEYKDDTFTE